MYYAVYNQMTDFETEYVFCKDSRLVLIGECLFAKAGALALEAPPSSPGAHLHLKQHTQIQRVLTQILKVANLTSYKKYQVRYFKLKLHIHTLEISETYFTSCKNEHNRSLLIYKHNIF